MFGKKTKDDKTSPYAWENFIKYAETGIACATSGTMDVTTAGDGTRAYVGTGGTSTPTYDPSSGTFTFQPGTSVVPGTTGQVHLVEPEMLSYSTPVPWHQYKLPGLNPAGVAASVQYHPAVLKAQSENTKALFHDVALRMAGGGDALQVKLEHKIDHDQKTQCDVVCSTLYLWGLPPVNSVTTGRAKGESKVAYAKRLILGSKC
jgi:hypothetical protein